MEGRIAGVVLAAGASRRLGQPKQLLRDPAGHALVARTVRCLADAGCAPVVVITGSAHDEVARAVQHLDATVVLNASWAEGMGASIRCAIAWLETHDSGPTPLSATVIAACDMPTVTADHVRLLRELSDAGDTRVASRYADARGEMVLGIPAVLPRADWPALTSISGDQGARTLLRAPDTVSVFLHDGNFDLDTPEDLGRWREHTGEEIGPGEHREST